MSTTPLPPFLSQFAAYDQRFVGQVAQIREDAYYTPGALDVKTKILIALALDLFSDSATGTRLLATRARDAGATDAEIAEVVKVCYSVAGLQKMSTAVHAFTGAATAETGG
jgi:alkylhydroperoxidase/carboxymuconolactone decarboxylase family protein YurZ